MIADYMCTSAIILGVAVVATCGADAAVKRAVSFSHFHFRFLRCRHRAVSLQRHGALGAGEGEQHPHLLRGRALGHALLRLQGRGHLDDDVHGAFLWIYQWQLLLPVGGATFLFPPPPPPDFPRDSRPAPAADGVRRARRRRSSLPIIDRAFFGFENNGNSFVRLYIAWRETAGISKVTRGNRRGSRRRDCIKRSATDLRPLPGRTEAGRLNARKTAR